MSRCPGCGRDKPGPEDIQASRDGLGDPFSPHCWAGIDGRPPCPIWEAMDGKHWNIVVSGNQRALERLRLYLGGTLWPGEPTFEHDDHLLIREGHPSSLSVLLTAWELLDRRRHEAVKSYAAGFVAGFEDPHRGQR